MPKMRRNVESARRFNVFRAHNRQRKKGARCYNLVMKTGWIFLLDLLLDGVMVTLAAYCEAHEVDLHAAAERELARVWTKVDAIRAKQAAKPVGSALPQ